MHVTFRDRELARNKWQLPYKLPRTKANAS